MMQLHNEAFSLPEALLDHVLKAKLVTKEGEALPEQLTASQFKSFVPQLDKKNLRFWMILHQEAFQEFKRESFDKLPRQRCEETRNANLGNWQASSSFAKQAAFYAWIVNRHPKLSIPGSFRAQLRSGTRSFCSISFLHGLGPDSKLGLQSFGYAACMVGGAFAVSFPAFDEAAWRASGSFRLAASKLHQQQLAGQALHNGKLRLGINFQCLAAFPPLEA